MGSLTDYPQMKKAETALTEFNIPFKTEILSAHRTAEEMLEFSKNAHLNGYKVIIAGAGGAAHLPGMVASVTPLPLPLAHPQAFAPLIKVHQGRLKYSH